MATRIDKMKLDVEELNSLLKQANRQRTKDVLMLEIRKLQAELEQKNTFTTIPTVQKCYEVKLDSYGWDQTNTTMKLYVTLNNVHQLPKEAVVCNFTERSMDLHVFGLDNKNYYLLINNLCAEIDAEKSTFKVRTNMVVVSLAKKVAKDWSHVTLAEKRIKDAKLPKPDEDHKSSMMNLMHQIYNKGDRDIKKTIAKWIEGQEMQKHNAIFDL